MKIQIEKLSNPYHNGDWHDPMLKWAVIGPGSEVQYFANKGAAIIYIMYKKIRKSSKDLFEATRKFVWGA